MSYKILSKEEIADVGMSSGPMTWQLKASHEALRAEADTAAWLGQDNYALKEQVEELRADRDRLQTIYEAQKVPWNKLGEERDAIRTERDALNERLFNDVMAAKKSGYDEGLINGLTQTVALCQRVEALEKAAQDVLDHAYPPLPNNQRDATVKYSWLILLKQALAAPAQTASSKSVERRLKTQAEQKEE
jgi:hypothetical protein